MYIMKYLSMLFLVLIVSCNKADTNITPPKKPQQLPQENIALLVDNSLSMIAKDFEPNRITVIKNVIKNIIDQKKENQAFSIVVFAKNSYILCPLTKDKNQLLSAINNLDAGIMQLHPGTVFSHVILNGMRSISKESGNKSMILFSDGKESTKSYPLEIAVQDAIKNNIKINTVMITPKDFTIMPISIDSKGKFQYQKLKAEPADTIQLKKISTETGGTFKLFYTKDAIQKFNFSQLLSEKGNSNIKKIPSKISDDKLNKIYREIEMSNDSLAVIFNR